MGTGDREDRPVDPAESTEPGWRPDPRTAGRFRYWDGRRWSELSASTPMGRATRPPDDGEGQHAAGPSQATRIAVTALVAVTAVVVAVVVGLAITGDDAPGDESPASTTEAPQPSTAEAADAPTESGTEPGGAEPDGTEPDGAAPNGPPPDSATTAPPAATALTPEEATAPCSVDAGVLVALLDAHPPLEAFAGRLGARDVRCAGRWASAIVSAEATDEALALFESTDRTWELLLVGSAEPCSGLAIAPEAEAILGCDFG